MSGAEESPLSALQMTEDSPCPAEDAAHSEEAAAVSGASDVVFTADTLTIGTASNLLGSFYHKDYKKYFDAICKELGRPAESSFQEYASTIATEPLQWLNCFPANLHSKSAFSKPKTAMLNLLANSSVVAALGGDFCKEVTRSIESTFKAHSNAIVHKRSSVQKKRVMHVRDVGGDDADDDVGSNSSASGDSSSEQSKARALEAELAAATEKLGQLKAFVHKLADLVAEHDIYKGETLKELMARW